MRKWFIDGTELMLKRLPAFVFDIDGVVKRGPHILPEAKDALGKLYTDCRSKQLLPLCFMTNGGGVTEATKAAELSHWLDVPVNEHQVILSHTPMRLLAQQYADQHVLVAGIGNVVDVARSYGFKYVSSTEDLARGLPGALPLRRQHAIDQQTGTSPAVHVHDASRKPPFAAVFVMHDPNDWYTDLQIIIDVIMSRGKPWTTWTTADAQSAPGIPVYISNPDLLFAGAFSSPRLGGAGVFCIALNAIYNQIGGQDLKCRVTHFGKPGPEPYRLAEKILLQQMQSLELPCQVPHPDSPASVWQDATRAAFSNIYMVGDNPLSDIRGANQAGMPWRSMLVRTGVFCGEKGTNSSDEKAHVVCDHVDEAVSYGIKESAVSTVFSA